MSPKSQDPISKEDLHTFLTYVLSHQVKDQKHAKELRRLSRRTTTLSDVVVVFQTLMKQQDRMITQLMDAIQIQQRVLEKLGASDDMFKEAQDEYNEELKEMQEKLKATIEKKDDKSESEPEQEKEAKED